MWENFSIIHFNDVYNIESGTKEPIGGASRFVASLKSQKHLNPLIIFSGDVLSPSLISRVTRGEHMVGVLNSCDVDVAVYGNHEFDYGIEHLHDIVVQFKFPWLMSNILDNYTQKNLADGASYHIIEKNGCKIGLIGLVEYEWITTLSTIDVDDITYIDYTLKGNELCTLLKGQLQCDLVIALTHMRWPNDTRLARSCPEIDLILGGHDHVFQHMVISDRIIIKSGTDFRNYSIIHFYNKGHASNNSDNNSKPILTTNGHKIEIVRVNITSDLPQDEEIKLHVERYVKLMGDSMDKVLGVIKTDLDARFCVIRRFESTAGNFISDIMLNACDADIAFLNSGTLRSDQIHKAGNFTYRDLFNLLPMLDSLLVVLLSGQQIKEALENSCRMWPALEGRFLQLSGITYTFDARRDSGNRLVSVYLTNGEALDLSRKYRVCMKEYLRSGKDGFTVLSQGQVLLDSEDAPLLSSSVINHFETMHKVSSKKCKTPYHHQSIISKGKRKIISQSMPGSPVTIGKNSHDLSICRYKNISSNEMSTIISALSPRIEKRIEILGADEVIHQYNSSM
ncbi:hypothetical protein A3Q56_02862 [Intoshia linei]|uniref:5'-nucleotidase n=1 Tax=Intoshia linei TaxID=1819745 RepID=A0A177B501_9BILA|nr:hypothetical protein A3Q56_02862 [Intoshia linei]